MASYFETVLCRAGTRSDSRELKLYVRREGEAVLDEDDISFIRQWALKCIHSPLELAFLRLAKHLTEKQRDKNIAHDGKRMAGQLFEMFTKDALPGMKEHPTLLTRDTGKGVDELIYYTVFESNY